jgi:hypothetical protein
MNDGWHWLSITPRISTYKTIATVFRDAAKAGQNIPRSVVEKMINYLTDTTEDLNVTCAECLSIIAHKQESFEPEQMRKIQQVLERTDNISVKQKLIEIYALHAQHGHHVKLDLVSIEKDLLEM